MSSLRSHRYPRAESNDGRHYPKQPRVGDLIEVMVGVVVVIAVHDHGRRLYVTDELGRVHHVERAETGCWLRVDPETEVA